ncbi:hypothetical protein [Prevotellamassilia timonensis]|jgi:hypothetical protein|uniref:hypothetical protein n=1 Tax=Prevotellamassilia timonensis TaxID=1852370 RepID=UPI003FD8FBCF
MKQQYQAPKAERIDYVAPMSPLCESPGGNNPSSYPGNPDGGNETPDNFSPSKGWTGNDNE